jgi:hypothetical protein
MIEQSAARPWFADQRRTARRRQLGRVGDARWLSVMA